MFFRPPFPTVCGRLLRSERVSVLTEPSGPTRVSGTTLEDAVEVDNWLEAVGEVAVAPLEVVEVFDVVFVPMHPLAITPKRRRLRMRTETALFITATGQRWEPIF